MSQRGPLLGDLLSFDEAVTGRQCRRQGRAKAGPDFRKRQACLGGFQAHQAALSGKGGPEEVGGRLCSDPHFSEVRGTQVAPIRMQLLDPQQQSRLPVQPEPSHRLAGDARRQSDHLGPSIRYPLGLWRSGGPVVCPQVGEAGHRFRGNGGGVDDRVPARFILPAMVAIVYYHSTSRPPRHQGFDADLAGAGVIFPGDSRLRRAVQPHNGYLPPRVGHPARRMHRLRQQPRRGIGARRMGRGRQQAGPRTERGERCEPQLSADHHLSQGPLHPTVPL